MNGGEYTLPTAGITYTSTDASFSGTDTFSYTIEDTAGTRSTATVTVSIAGNEAPIATADSYEVAAGDAIEIDVLSNDSDPEGTELSVVSFTQPSHGTVTQSFSVPDELQYEYESSGGAYYYGSIEAYVDDYYGGWQGYADYQSYV